MAYILRHRQKATYLVTACATAVFGMSCASPIPLSSGERAFAPALTGHSGHATDSYYEIHLAAAHLNSDMEAEEPYLGGITRVSGNTEFGINLGEDRDASVMFVGPLKFDNDYWEIFYGRRKFGNGPNANSYYGYGISYMEVDADPSVPLPGIDTNDGALGIYWRIGTSLGERVGVDVRYRRGDDWNVFGQSIDSDVFAIALTYRL